VTWTVTPSGPGLRFVGLASFLPTLLLSCARAVLLVINCLLLASEDHWWHHDASDTSYVVPLNLNLNAGMARARIHSG
jgi:hypothetical protein